MTRLSKIQSYSDHPLIGLLVPYWTPHPEINQYKFELKKTNEIGNDRTNDNYTISPVQYRDITSVKDYCDLLDEIIHKNDETKIPIEHFENLTKIREKKEIVENDQDKIIELNIPNVSIFQTINPHNLINMSYQFSLIHLHNSLSPTHPSVQFVQNVLYNGIERTFPSTGTLFSTTFIDKRCGEKNQSDQNEENIIDENNDTAADEKSDGKPILTLNISGIKSLLYHIRLHYLIIQNDPNNDNTDNISLYPSQNDILQFIIYTYFTKSDFAIIAAQNDQNYPKLYDKIVSLQTTLPPLFTQIISFEDFFLPIIKTPGVELLPNHGPFKANSKESPPVLYTIDSMSSIAKKLSLEVLSYLPTLETTPKASKIAPLLTNKKISSLTRLLIILSLHGIQPFGVFGPFWNAIYSILVIELFSPQSRCSIPTRRQQHKTCLNDALRRLELLPVGVNRDVCVEQNNIPASTRESIHNAIQSFQNNQPRYSLYTRYSPLVMTSPWCNFLHSSPPTTIQSKIGSIAITDLDPDSNAYAYWLPEDITIPPTFSTLSTFPTSFNFEEITTGPLVKLTLRTYSPCRLKIYASHVLSLETVSLTESLNNYLSFLNGLWKKEKEKDGTTTRNVNEIYLFNPTLVQSSTLILKRFGLFLQMIGVKNQNEILKAVFLNQKNKNKSDQNGENDQNVKVCFEPHQQEDVKNNEIQIETNDQITTPLSTYATDFFHTQTQFCASVVSQMAMTPQRAQELTQTMIEISTIVETTSHNRFTVYPYGSVTSCLSQPNSDIDLRLISRPLNGNIKLNDSLPILDEVDRTTALKVLKKIAYTSQKSFKTVSTVVSERVRIPMITLCHKTNGVNVDLTITKDQTIPKSNFFKFFINFSPLVHPLLTLVKFWAKSRSISDASAGYMNSFSFNLLVIFFLQIKGILPVLHSNGAPNPHFVDFEQIMKEIDSKNKNDSNRDANVDKNNDHYMKNILELNDPMKPNFCLMTTESDFERKKLNYFDFKFIPHLIPINSNNDQNGQHDQDDNIHFFDPNPQFPLLTPHFAQYTPESLSSFTKHIDTSSNSITAKIKSRYYLTSPKTYKTNNITATLFSSHFNPYIEPTVRSTFKSSSPNSLSGTEANPVMLPLGALDTFQADNEKTLYSINWSWFAQYSYPMKGLLFPNGDQSGLGGVNNNNNNNIQTHPYPQFTAFIGPARFDSFIRYAHWDPDEHTLSSKGNLVQLHSRSNSTVLADHFLRYSLLTPNQMVTQNGKPIGQSNNISTTLDFEQNNAKNNKNDPPPDPKKQLYQLPIPNVPSEQDQIWSQVYTLFREFFFFYAFVFNPTVHAVSVRNGYLTWLSDYHLANHNYDFLKLDRISFFIEDPFNCFDNTARSLTPPFVDQIFFEMRRAALLFMTNSHISTVCNPINHEMLGIYGLITNNRVYGGNDKIFEKEFIKHSARFAACLSSKLLRVSEYSEQTFKSGSFIKSKNYLISLLTNCNIFLQFKDDKIELQNNPKNNNNKSYNKQRTAFLDHLFKPQNNNSAQTTQTTQTPLSDSLTILDIPTSSLNTRGVLSSPDKLIECINLMDIHPGLIDGVNMSKNGNLNLNFLKFANDFTYSQQLFQIKYTLYRSVDLYTLHSLDNNANGGKQSSGSQKKGKLGKVHDDLIDLYQQGQDELEDLDNTNGSNIPKTTPKIITTSKNKDQITSTTTTTIIAPIDQLGNSNPTDDAISAANQAANEAIKTAAKAAKDTNDTTTDPTATQTPISPERSQSSKPAIFVKTYFENKDQRVDDKGHDYKPLKYSEFSTWPRARVDDKITHLNQKLILIGKRHDPSSSLCDYFVLKNFSKPDNLCLDPFCTGIHCEEYLAMAYDIARLKDYSLILLGNEVNNVLISGGSRALPLFQNYFHLITQQKDQINEKNHEKIEHVENNEEIDQPEELGGQIDGKVEEENKSPIGLLNFEFPLWYSPPQSKPMGTYRPPLPHVFKLNSIHPLFHNMAQEMIQLGQFEANLDPQVKICMKFITPTTSCPLTHQECKNGEHNGEYKNRLETIFKFLRGFSALAINLKTGFHLSFPDFIDPTGPVMVNEPITKRIIIKVNQGKDGDENGSKGEKKTRKKIEKKIEKKKNEDRSESKSAKRKKKWGEMTRSDLYTVMMEDAEKNNSNQSNPKRKPKSKKNVESTKNTKVIQITAKEGAEDGQKKSQKIDSNGSVSEQSRPLNRKEKRKLKFGGQEGEKNGNIVLQDLGLQPRGGKKPKNKNKSSEQGFKKNE